MDETQIPQTGREGGKQGEGREAKEMLDTGMGRSFLFFHCDGGRKYPRLATGFCVHIRSSVSNLLSFLSIRLSRVLHNTLPCSARSKSV